MEFMRSLAVLNGVPGISYADNRVDFTAPDFAAAYDGAIALIGVATRSYPQVAFEMIRARPDSAKLMLAYNERLIMRWLDFESGRWIAPTPPPAIARRYHGAR